MFVFFVWIKNFPGEKTQKLVREGNGVFFVLFFVGF